MHDRHRRPHIRPCPGLSHSQWPAVAVDAFNVYKGLIQNGGFNNGTTSWSVWPGTDFAVYGAGVTGNNPYEGTGFGATNTTQNTVDIYQDIPLTINAGDTYCVTAEVVTQGTGSGAGGSLYLWFLGGTGRRGSSQAFSNLPGGNSWTPVQTCTTATAAHTSVRAQVYPTPNGPTVAVDAFEVHKNLLQNGGYDRWHHVLVCMGRDQLSPFMAPE